MAWRRPKQWKKLLHIERRSPEWLAARYRSTLARATEYAKNRSAGFPEPMGGLLKSLRCEELSPIWNKAVISVEAPPFKGGLHQTYSWEHIACSDPRELGRELVTQLQEFLRYTQRKRASEALARLRETNGAA
jgi:hypothetical protein